MYQGIKEWEGNNKEIIFSKNQRLNDFIFASEFLRDAKDMRMLEESGKIANDRNMDELMDKDAPTLVPPPDDDVK
jgi:phospholipid/cholesterol/gamma-HCH transport system ATP-binding protein